MDYNPQELYDQMENSLDYPIPPDTDPKDHKTKLYAKVMEWLEANAVKPSVEAIKNNASKIQSYLDGKSPLVIKTDNVPAPEPEKKGWSGMSPKSRFLLLGIIGIVVYLIFFNKKAE